jgi:hypothetical protein
MPRGKDGFGTFRDLERLAVQFTADLRKMAMQSSSSGENVITDLRSILEEALERIKSEIFGSPHEAAGPDAPPAAPGQPTRPAAPGQPTRPAAPEQPTRPAAPEQPTEEHPEQGGTAS